MQVFPESSQQNNDGVRPPPPPPVTVRTMESDVKSMDQTGGGKPVGETLNLPRRAPDRPEPPRLSEEGIKIKIPGYSGPEEKMFSPETLPEQKPEVVEEKKSFKIIPVIIVAIAAALIGALGYFFVYPLFVQVDTAGDTATEGATPPPAEPPPPIRAHVSLIKADKTEVADSMAAATSETPGEAQLVKELSLQNSAGVQIILSEYWPELLPEFDANEIIKIFEEDFTAFIYYDKNGAWPGYVLKTKEGVSPLVSHDFFGKIESSENLGGLFIEDAGEKSGDWKSGDWKGVATRYLTFSGNGAALNYAWADEKTLVIASYFPALQEILDNRLIK